MTQKMKLTFIALALYAAAYGLLTLIWGGLIVWDKPSPEQAQYITYIHDALLMLTAHILTILNTPPPPGGENGVNINPAPTYAKPPPPPPPPAAQAGFASIKLLLTIVLVGFVALGLTGCASWIQALNGYNTTAMVSARATEDLNVKVWTENACGTPLSTIIRHPEIAGGLKSLCFNGSPSTATDVLNAVPAVLAPTVTPAPAK